MLWICDSTEKLLKCNWTCGAAARHNDLCLQSNQM